MATEQDLYKVIKEQEKQISSLKSAVTILERRLLLIERRERSRDVTARQSKQKIDMIETKLRG